MKLCKVGLIVNPRAGMGAARNLKVAREVLEILQASYVVTGSGEMGQDAIPHARHLAMPDLQGRAASQWLARELISLGIDVLVVVGGDGTMADVAFVLMEAKSKCPILGIGAGSTNVGDLITCRAEEISTLENARLLVHETGALIAGCNGQDLALAFNDVVIGATVVGMLGERVRDLDATAFIQGERKVGRPQPVGGEKSLVTKLAREEEIAVARGKAVGTVIVGFAHHECFFGKAIVGGVCLTSLTGQPAGCLVCTQPLVRTELTQDKLAAVEPLHTSYISLREDETIRVTGVGPPAVLCADGNPLKPLACKDVVTIRYRPLAVRVLRLGSEDA